MKRKRLFTLLGSICLVLVLAALLLPACAKEAPAPTVPTPAPTVPTPTPTVPTPTPTPTPAPPEAWQPPKSIVLRTTSSGGTGYAEATAIAIAIEEATGVRVSAPPTDTPLGQLLPIKDGREECTWFVASEAMSARDGTFEFSQEDWGPQSLRSVWFGTPLPQGFATRGNSGIKTLADMVGRRLTRLPPTTAGGTARTDALFAYSTAHPDYPALSWDNVEAVNVSEFGPGQQAVLSGAAEVANFSATSSAAYELAASLGGICWIPLSNVTEGDKMAWDAWRKVNPAEGIPIRLDSPEQCAGASKENPADLFGWPYLVVCYDFYPDDNLVYWLVKQFDETYLLYKDKHPQLAEWNVDTVFKGIDGWIIPWHNGAVQYFKDIGRWTPEAQARQDELLLLWPENTK